MNADRFLQTCDQLKQHWSGQARLGAHWDRVARDAIERVRAHPGASLFSTRNHLMQRFGGGAWAADSYVLGRRTIVSAVQQRYESAVRRVFGYGRLGGALLGPWSDSELRRTMVLYSRVNYENAVRTGYYLLRDPVEKHDVRAHEIFAEQRVDVEGRPLSWLTLVSLRAALVLREIAGPADTVLEIGSGTGELARMMLTIGAARRYVLVDIAPALPFAQEVLASQFGDGAMAFFDPSREWSGDLMERSCVFLSPDQLRIVPSAQLAINIASFGEMPTGAVREYIDEVKRIGPRTFISVNTRNPHPVNIAEGIDSAFYVSSFSPEFRLLGRYQWSKTLDTRVRVATDAYDGYELLHFASKSAAALQP